MTMSPREQHKKAEELREPAMQARKLLTSIMNEAKERKDGENAVTAGRRLERIHGWAGEAHEHLDIYVQASVDEMLSTLDGDWEDVK